MVLLENDLFLLELTKMFQKSRSTGTGSVSMTMKKYDGRDRPTPKSNPRKPGKKSKAKEKDAKTKGAPHTSAHPAPPPDTTCLIRAKLHTRKISTIVHSKDVTRFQIVYCSLLRGNMDGLKKLKKSKAKATKAT